jgi:uncharacterized membrane protein
MTIVDVQALLIGVASGLRTLVGPTAVLFIMRLPPVVTWFSAILALAEMYGDKSPKAPPRIVLPSLLARVLFGAASAFFLTMIFHGVPIRGAAIGAIGALIGAYGGYYARRELTRPGIFGDFGVAIFEDVLTVLIAYLAITV